MSRLCAKPTCAEPAAAWLDLLRNERRVIERRRPSPTALSLCASHRSRFGVPQGWILEVLDTEEEPDGDSPASSVTDAREGVSDPQGDAREPWFLARPDAESARRPADFRPLLPGTSRGHQQAPELDRDVGSLLRRAFHGPDRDEDLRRLDEEQHEPVNAVEVDELEQRRHARAAVDEYGTAQLPFPPLEGEPQIAVS